MQNEKVVMGAGEAVSCGLSRFCFECSLRMTVKRQDDKIYISCRVEKTKIFQTTY